MMSKGVTAKKLDWRKSTDHPQDSGQWVADGIGGRYSAEKQRDGTWLLWWAHDNFVWEACADFAEVKAKAEADWQAQYVALALVGSEREQAVNRIIALTETEFDEDPKSQAARLLPIRQIARTFLSPAGSASAREEALRIILGSAKGVELTGGSRGYTISIRYDYEDRNEADLLCDKMIAALAQPQVVGTDGG